MTSSSSPLDLGGLRLAEGWTATSRHSLAHVAFGGFFRQVTRVTISFTHETGGRAEVDYIRPVLGGEPWVMRSCAAWVSDLTHPHPITPEELRWLVTDEEALKLAPREDEAS